MLLLLKNLLFTVIVPGTVAIWVPLWIEAGSPAASGPARLGAGALLALGAGIYAWCVWDFAAFGRGTPAPIDAPKRLVVRGLYHWSRNPMYLGVLCVILGQAAWFGSGALLLYALAVAACFTCFVRFYEEPTLRRLFGAEYEDYCSRVGRWLPRIAAQARPRGA